MKKEICWRKIAMGRVNVDHRIFVSYENKVLVQVPTCILD